MVKTAGEVGSSLGGQLSDGRQANCAGKGSAGREESEIRLKCQLLVPWEKELLLSQKTP